MKILLASSKFPPEYSGSGLRAYNTFCRLRDSFGIEFEVICNSVTHCQNSKYNLSGVNVYRIGRFFQLPHTFLKRKIAVFLNMTREFCYTLLFILPRLHKFDGLHTFGSSWSVNFLTIIFYLRGKPVVRELCNELNTPYYPPQLSCLMRKAFKKKNMWIIAISHSLNELCLKHNVRNVWNRPNPIDERRFNLKDAFRRKDSKDKRVIIVYPANYRPSKNHTFLLDVLKYLPSNFYLMLKGPLAENNQKVYDDILNRIKDYKMEDRVHIEHGFIDDMGEVYKSADVSVFPSLSEGLGTPVIESQACGVPVVANLIPGVTDKEINDGKGGFTTSLDASEFAKKIEAAAAIPKATLIENAKMVLSRASASKIDLAYYNLWKEALTS